MKLKEKRLPVLVLIEGWGAAGKGSAIGQIIRNIDPRFFKVFSMPSTPTEEERRRPFLYRFFEKIPEAGKFTFLDSGWMDQIMKERLDGKLDDKAYAQRVDSVKRFERGLTDNGYLVLKFFFHISKKEQENRIEALLSEKDTAWRVSEGDLWQNRHYDKCLEAFDRYLDDTNTPSAPWYIVDSKSKKFAELQVMETLCMGIETALHNESLAVPLLQNVFPLIKMPKLKDVPLDKTISEEDALEAARRSEGYPYMVQLVGYYMWQSAQRRGSNVITADDVSTGVSDALLAFDDAVCAPALDGITGAERLFLMAMAKDSPNTTQVGDIADRTRRSRSWVSKYRALLIKDKLIRPAGHGQLEFAVPHLGQYLQSL